LDYIIIDKNSKSRPKDLLRTLLDSYPQFSGCSFKMINTQELNNAIVEIEMKLVCFSQCSLPHFIISFILLLLFIYQLLSILIILLS
jgi:hypothetical protein